MQQREEKKCELVECEANMQRVQIGLKHDSVQVEKESRFTPYKISFADEVPHHLIGSGDQDNGVGHFYAPFDFTTCVMDNATMGVQIKAQKQTQKQFAHLHNQHRKKMNIANALQPSFLFSKPLDPKKLAAANITTCLHNTIPYHSCGRTGQGGHLKPTDTNTFRFVKQTLLIFCICSCIGQVGSFPASLLAACCRPLCCA